jgi:hypothetical protein
VNLEGQGKKPYVSQIQNQEGEGSYHHQLWLWKIHLKASLEWTMGLMTKELDITGGPWSEGPATYCSPWCPEPLKTCNPAQFACPKNPHLYV